MIRSKKSLSQNFLIDKNICRKILKYTEVKNKIILEIGPGYGSLTDFIIQQKPKKLYLVEKDFHLINFLTKKYENNSNVEIIGKDILKYDLKNIKNIIVISNLPYNVATKIILYLFNFNDNIVEMIFMLQKEVALKFNYNLPIMNKYKFLTKVVSNFTICFDISSKVFVPKPKVKSSLVKFEFKRKNFNLEKANSFSKKIFKNIRKKISNNLKIKLPDPLLDKRVNEISINDLMRIYNFF